MTDALSSTSRKEPGPDGPPVVTGPQVSALAGRIFAGCGSVVFRLMQRYRSYIAPIAEVVSSVPPGSAVLDVGCGGGLLLHVLARTGRLAAGSVGFDSSPGAIKIAQDALARHAALAGSTQQPVLRFELRAVADGWPAGPDDLGGLFDVVTIVDVIHHVGAGLQASGSPAGRSAQRGVIEQACDLVRPGGLLIYKDMCRRPLWRAWANRCHDLLMARQWINYCPVEDVEAWARERGMVVLTRGRRNMWWYGHEGLVLQKRRPT